MTARLADELIQIGRKHGLDSVGICDAAPFEDERQILEERKALGWSAGMQFTFRNPARSTTPEVTLPNAAALIVGARRYRRRAPMRTPRTARVAQYSWIDHYPPLREALGAVADRLKADGWRSRVVADDNALMDRAAAVRAGLGWYGKNSNVLLDDAGSWFVLGSVITDAPLAGHTSTAVPDPPAKGCGTCQRCITACPTGAIVAPGQLDARRCLAWLLQAPGDFPVEYREALGDRIYGCDDCQDVCPINRLADRRDPPPEPETDAQPVIDILRLLDMTDDQLLEQVGRWYIPGREPRYVRRNALVVLGNTADPDDPAAQAALRQGRQDADPLIREHAEWAASRLAQRKSSA